MAAFRDTRAVAERLNNNPGQIVSLMEGILTPDQVASFEDALFPAADEATRRRALEEARTILVRAGVPSEDSAVAALDLELASP